MIIKCSTSPRVVRSLHYLCERTGILGAGYMSAPLPFALLYHWPWTRISPALYSPKLRCYLLLLSLDRKAFNHMQFFKIIYLSKEQFYLAILFSCTVGIKDVIAVLSTNAIDQFKQAY